MVMKDKLYKYNHKKGYYVFRRAVLSTFAFIGFSLAVALPTTINLLSTEAKLTLAVENKVEAEEENSSENLENFTIEDSQLS